MQSTTIEATQPQRASHNVVVRVQFGTRRCVVPPEVLDSHAVVERVLCGARLDGITREQMVRILTVTVQQWVRK